MNLSESDLRKSFLFWRAEYRHVDTDTQLEPFLAIPASGRCWLKKAREALFLSSRSMAERLKISRSSYTQLERKELAGEVTLRKLHEVAAAMDCEVIYCLRPVSRKLFSEVIWESLFEKAIASHWVQSRPEHRKYAALSAVAKQVMKDSQFRKKQGWSERL